MPNWCNNNITISGPTETIGQLWKDAEAAEGLLEAMVPMPKALVDTTAPSQLDEEAQAELIKAHGAADWYSWCVNNWSTKWDISLEGLEFIDNGDGTAEITGWFDSAWAPPIGAYEKFADMMDNCDIQASYHEPGMDFAGLWSTADGDEYCEDLHGEYKLAEDDRSDLFNRLDEEYNLCEQFAEWEDEGLYEDE